MGPVTLDPRIIYYLLGRDEANSKAKREEEYFEEIKVYFFLY